MSFTDTFATPDDRASGYLRSDELHTSAAESLVAGGAQDFADSWPMRAWRGTQQALAGNPEMLGATVDAALPAPIGTRDDVPDTSIADAKARVKEEGLEGHVNLPDQPSVKAPVLDLMIQDAHERRDREAAIERGPHNLAMSGLQFGTSLGVGVVDPVNIAAFMVPVLGEAKLGKMLFDAGDSLVARAGAKAVEGAYRGAAGTALLQPAEWWYRTHDGQDYTMADALRSIVMGAGMGAGFHAGLGAYGDLKARRAGLPLEGDANDTIDQLMVSSGLSKQYLKTRALKIMEREGVQDPHEAFARAAAEYGFVPPHPAEVLADLPPGAREDVFRAATADLIQGRPVRASEMLHEAAKADPRVAETIDAWHGSPHNFGAFSLDHVGTGEGAASYGHGLYFAEKEAVARDYAKKLSSPTRGAGATSSAGMKFSDFKAPNVYRVRIKAAKEHFLDWDRPLSEQPEVLARLNEHPNPSIAGMAEKHGDSGRTFYKRLSSTIAKAPDHVIDVGAYGKHAASDLLREAGIPGIKYLDQDSRRVGAGAQAEDAAINLLDAVGGDRQKAIAEAESRLEHAASLDEKYQSKSSVLPDALTLLKSDWKDPRTQNLVVFNDKDVDITHKNGEPVSRGEPDWNSLANARPAYEEPEAVAASKLAKATPEPASVDAAEAPAAAEKVAQDADQLLKDMLPKLSDDERQLLEDALGKLEDDKTARERIVRDGAACLAEAAA